MKRTVIDNAIPQESFIKLQNVFNESFPWYTTATVTYDGDTKNAPSNFYKFSHMFYEQLAPRSSYFNELTPLFTALNPSAIKFCRAFLTTYTGSKVNQGMHSDFEHNFGSVDDHLKTSVFYVNTNNGGTLFEDGEFVESVENRLLTFDIRERHATVTADNVSKRIVINTVYF